MNQPHSPTLWPNYPVPERPDYRPYPARMDRLPYVKHHRNPAKCSNWAVAPPDYGTACARGREYAAHLAIYLSQNPSWVGSNILNGIAEDMDFNDRDTKGYWVGFFAFLEIMVYHFARAHDPWACFERVDASYRKIHQQRERRAKS